MARFIEKAMKAVYSDCKNRGFYITFLMLFSQAIGFARGLLYKWLYMRNIRASLYSMQANSRIECFHKHAKAAIGKFVFIRKNASIRIDWSGELTIEDKVFINDNCNINCVNKIVIGEGTKIAPNVSINDHDHNYKQALGGGLLKGEVIIGKHVWIGSNSVILRDTVIGDYAVIAAGSVVKGHVPANTLFMNRRDNKHIPFSPSTDHIKLAQGG